MAGERTTAEVLALGLYGLLMRVLTPFMLAKCWWRGRHEPAYRERWLERLGFGPRQEGGWIWLHAVSLGETRAAEPLIRALRVANPGMKLLLTCSTATGWEAGQALLAAGDAHAWLPFDTPGAVRRFLKRFRPRVGLLMETEVWPSLMHESSRTGLPMVLVNARLSAKSLRQGQRLGVLLKPAVRPLVALAQTREDADRLTAMGAARIEVMGNLKYDLALKDELLRRGQAWREQLSGRPVVLAAIFREGEDEPLIECWRALREPERPLLVLVPRHPQRFDEVAARVQKAGLSLSRRSAWRGEPTGQDVAADVWLGDSLGEMQAYAALADVALLGGSFARLGGHNLIEVAACACPLVMGPHTFNFAQAADSAQAHGAAWRVADMAEGVAQALEVLKDAARLQAARDHASRWASGQQGATQRTVKALQAWLS